ncbi:hypothetical protein EVAR_33989_1 [Eumeta japonica]|uniref:Uncharacterized protein n=1 Tax=Eumeta variegata TaxID=151549 RepID=A0A4C1X1T9_EUMVA|nr:hypothetical protein EVAR_33989_1 [Eumeta japonica]
MVSVLESAPYTMVKNELAHFNKNQRAVKMILAQGVFGDFRQKGFLVIGDNIDKICDRIVTVDETWVRQYDPESKQESMQWTKKTAEEIQDSKVGIEAYGDNFWDSEEQSYRTTWEVNARSAVLQDNASVHGAGFEAGPEGHGLLEIDHHQPDRSQRLFPFSNLKRLRGRRFVDDNQMKMAVESHFE